jgi:hypothetical protein
VKIKFINLDGTSLFHEVQYPFPSEYRVPKKTAKITTFDGEVTVPIRVSVFSFYRNEDGTFEYKED